MAAELDQAGLLAKPGRPHPRALELDDLARLPYLSWACKVQFFCLCICHSICHPESCFPTLCSTSLQYQHPLLSRRLCMQVIGGVVYQPVVEDG